MECEKEFHAKLSDLFLSAPAIAGIEAPAGRMLLTPESAALPVSPARADLSWQRRGPTTA